MENRKTSWWYTAWVLFFTAIMFVGTVFAGLTGFGLISAVFHLVCSLIYVYGWQAIARRAPESMPKYYLAGSAFRLMAAAIVLLVYCVVERHDIQTIKWFAIVFIVYYIVTLVFDAVFFAKVSKNSNK